MSIRWLVFDVGNVIVQLRYQGLVPKLAEQMDLPLAQVQGVFADRFHLNGDGEPSLNERYQLGQISTVDYFPALVRALDNRMTIDQLQEAWLWILLGETPGMLELLQELKQDYRLACLSNTHDFHWQYLNKTYPCFELFEVKLASFQAGVAKPHPKIFADFCQLAKTEPSECLFVDDIAANIDGAKACGWQGIHYTSFDNLKQQLAMYLATS